MNCPACNRPIEPRTLFVCRRCWWDVPTKDRVSLHAMHNRNQDTSTKLAKIVRNLKEKHARAQTTG